MICFVIAMNSEAEPVINNMTETRTETEFGKKVVYGKINGKNTAVVVCGVGKVNAAIGAQFAIDRLNADAIINVGVAGGLNSTLEIANVYGIEQAVQYDFDLVQLNGTKMGTLNEFAEPYIDLATIPLYTLKKLGTGDRFNDDKKDFDLLTAELCADVRDMEGGAIAQTCFHANVPFYSFKAISDLAGSGSTTDQFLHNLALCSKKLESEIKNIFEAVYAEYAKDTVLF